MERIFMTNENQNREAQNEKLEEGIEIEIPLDSFDKESEGVEEEREEEILMGDEDEYTERSETNRELRGKEVEFIEIVGEDRTELFPHAGEDVSIESIRKDIERLARGTIYFIYSEGSLVPVWTTADIDANFANLSYGKAMIEANFYEDKEGELAANFSVVKRGGEEGKVTPISETVIEEALKTYVGQNGAWLKAKMKNAKERLEVLEKKD